MNPTNSTIDRPFRHGLTTRVAASLLLALALFGGLCLLLFLMLQPSPAQAQTFYSVCSRTLFVQEELIKTVRNLDSITAQQMNEWCGSVSASQLAGITSLDFGDVPTYHNTHFLKVGDFDNLTGLTQLDLSGLGLGTIKPRSGEFPYEDSTIHLGDLWRDLSNLETLSLADNKLYPRLPYNAFQGLGNLEELDMRNALEKPDQTSCNVDARETTPNAFAALTSLQTYNGSAYTAPPAAPMNLQVTRSGDVFTLTWDAPTGGTVTGYRIARNVNEWAPRQYEMGCSVGPGEQIGTTASGTLQYRDDMSWIRKGRGRGYDNLWSLEYHVNAQSASGLGPTATLRLSQEVVQGTPKLRANFSIGHEDQKTNFDRILGTVETKYSRQVPFTVTLWPAASQTVTVNYHTRSGTATEDVDYTGQSGTLTFNAGETEKTVIVPVIDDTIADSGEKFYLVLSTASGAPIAIAEATGTIYNDDPPPNLSVADAEGVEGDYSTLDFVVRVNPAVELTVTVDYATSDGTATAGEDYTATSGTLTFWPGQTTKTISVPITKDEVDDDGETVTLTLSNPSGENISDGEATGTIRDSTSESASVEPLWSADMTVADYENGNFGAGSADLLTNQGGSAGLKAKWLFYDSVRRELNLAFTTVIKNTSGLRLWMGSDVLAFSGGDSGITISNVENMGWTDGETIKVFVTDGSSVETSPANTAPTGLPTISGAIQGGETLTASTSGISDGDGLDNVSFSYQWIRGDSDIENATAATYTLEDADVGETIKVRVTFNDDEGHQESLTSAATEAVKAANNAATGAPTISGTAQVGQTLTASTSGIVDADGLDDVSYSYQWIRNDGTADVDIQDATAATYTLSDDDQGKIIKVRVTFTDDNDNQESLTSTATEAVAAASVQSNSAATGAPSISGTAQAGQTLTASTSGIVDTDGLDDVSYSYQWLADDADITDATASTYTLTDDDVGTTIKVRVSFTDDRDNQESLTSAATAAVTARPNNAATGAPTISGTAQAGQTLTASTSGISDADGLDDASYSYQWLADDADIQDATASTYTLTDDDVGTTIKVRVSFTDDRDNQESLTSTATAAVTARPNNAATGAPTISGTAQAGQTLTASTSDIVDDDGLDDVSYSYQWLADDADITDATASTYTLTDDDVGTTIKVRVSFTDDRDNQESLTSTATAAVTARPNNAATGAPTISGTAQAGQTLTASTSGIVDDDGLDDVSYSYQWLADDADITDATASTYTLTDDDVGKTIKVRVTFTDDRDNQESLTSAATSAVTARPNNSATGQPTISGTAQVGQTLTASTSAITDSDGLDNVSYSYQWIRSNGGTDSDIAGATSSTYDLVQADQGKNIKVKVSFTDDRNNQESLTSTATTTVAARPNNPATGAPTISGTAQVGQTLTASHDRHRRRRRSGQCFLQLSVDT